jgi:chromosomal replication initiation ATPase DnaA
MRELTVATQTFNAYALDKTNRAAYHLCRAVAARMPRTHTPLLLCGEPGTGKTHLL